MGFKRITKSEAEAARKKMSNQESAEFFRIEKSNTDYDIRILPAHPDSEAAKKNQYGTKVYSALLKLALPQDSSKFAYVKVFDPSLVFGDECPNLMLSYRNAVSDKYPELKDEAGKSTFHFGFKNDAYVLMYVLPKGESDIHLFECKLTLFDAIESAKMTTWNKLAAKDGGWEFCPITDFEKSYGLTLKKEGKGTSTKYSAMIDNFEGPTEIPEDILNKITDAKMFEDIISFDNRMLEAFIIYAKQFEDRHEIEESVVDSEDFMKIIDNVKSFIPASDTSKFEFKDDVGEDDEKSDDDIIDSIMDSIEDVDVANAEDVLDVIKKISDSGIELKAFGRSLRSFFKDIIEEQSIDIKVTRKVSDNDLLESILNHFNQSDF